MNIHERFGHSDPAIDGALEEEIEDLEPGRTRAKRALKVLQQRQYFAPPPPPDHVVRDLTFAVLAIVLGLAWLFADPAPAPLVTFGY